MRTLVYVGQCSGNRRPRCCKWLTEVLVMINRSVSDDLWDRYSRSASRAIKSMPS